MQEIHSWAHRYTFSSRIIAESSVADQRRYMRVAKTSRPLIRSPTHKFPSYTYTRLHYICLVRKIMSRDTFPRTLASLKFRIGIRGIAQRRSDMGNNDVRVLSPAKSSTVNTTKLFRGILRENIRYGNRHSAHGL